MVLGDHAYPLGTVVVFVFFVTNANYFADPGTWSFRIRNLLSFPISRCFLACLKGTWCRR